MTSTALPSSDPGTEPAPTSHRVPRIWNPWVLGLIALAIGSAVLTVWAVDSASESSYYAAIAVSMSQNPANFFFGAFDPAGTVTLDKIPGSFWIPALFVAAFGYSTWTVVLPNALAAVATVLIVAFAGKRLLSPTAGLIAGAVAATTPIFIAVSRSNQPETFFVLCLALVAWAAARALTRSSVGWLIGAGLFVALAFQMYMLEAWAIWPALALAYLFTTQSWWRRVWHLALAGTVSLAASLIWIIIVAAIPADSRPYIGSTLTNNPWEMVFGYNGLGRFAATSDSSAYLSFSPPFSGDASAVRLFNEQLAGQIAWLLPAAVLGIVVLWMLRFSRPVTVFLGAWLVTFGAMFSVVSGMHQFYTAALAIPIALIVGISFALARRRGILWPQIALLATAGVTAVMVSLWYPGYSTVVSIVQAIVAAAAILLLLAERSSDRVARWVVTAVATAGLILTPAVWSAVTIANPSALNPVAGGVSDAPGGGGRGQGGPGQDGALQGGPEQAGPAAGGRPGGGAPVQSTTGGAPGAVAGQRTDAAQGTGGPGGGAGAASAELISWLQQNQGDADYLIATFGAQSAATIILASDGGSVLPIGGFNGNDAVPTLEEFQAMVADGSLRYVLASGGQGQGQGPGAGGGASASAGAGGGGATTSTEIQTWVQSTCTLATDAPSGTVYDCASS